ncbi:hypothetical protein HCN44_004622 [Aphidius gifuensis]|uniref:Dynein regulatory complex subunit 2 n=1 Tax=Aphidius gifuensis TaxID=684658 RepID=A0A835CW73_APHGI|nr:hypothetical protein HCN44_004622 [Aphidius gifuensis]
MPAKKKKGKGSKLTRMNEEEKLRYLQHRAEIELEAKRRKQQLISIFTKNKLKREEAFSRLNTAKINEQWRFNLRQIKCKELDDEIKYLWSNFDRKIKLKNEQIDNLNVELINANLDHNKLQESHMKIIDKLILQHVEYLNKIHDDYKKSIINIQLNDLNEMIIIKNKLEKECWNFKSIIYAQSFLIEKKLSNTYSRNSMNTYYIQHTMEETIDNVNQQLGNKISKLWSLLIETITDYQKQTSLKKKQYDILKESDDKHKIETLQLKKYESQLELSIEKIKNKQIEFNENTGEIIKNLNNKYQNLNENIKILKNDIQINQKIHEIKLKKLTVISGNAISKLKNIKNKITLIITLFKICTNLAEPNLLATIKKYDLLNDDYDDDKDVVTYENLKHINPYDKLENFWEKYNNIKVENIIYNDEKKNLIIENKKLRMSLKNYIMTVGKITKITIDI